MRTRSFLVVAVAAAVVIQVAPANAQVPGVTLDASDTRINFGRSVALFGRIEPPTDGETVDIVNEAGVVVATATTDAQGRYRTRFAPRKNVGVRAQWLATFSDEVKIKVKPLIVARLGRTRLFARAQVRGRVRPANAADVVMVRLLRNGRMLHRRSISVRGGGWFRTTFRVRDAGRYRAKVRVDPSEHLPARELTAAREPPTPALASGSRGIFVKLLERRLLELGYYLPGADRVYDHKTSDAVIAFNKVQRRSRVGSVTESTWRALASPRRARPRVGGGFHIEIDQTRQVILVVRGRKVRRILHTSTGAGGATRDGRYRVFRKLAGTSGGGLYHPSYFDGLRAIHGWSEVPTYPASHGCARVPMWAARWIYGVAEMGTRVIVYH